MKEMAKMTLLELKSSQLACIAQSVLENVRLCVYFVESKTPILSFDTYLIVS
jgi:hypothetical protein